MPRTLSLIACLLLVAGCQRDEIQTYTVPKPLPPSEVRLLAAILDHGDDQWYVKLLGEADAVTKQGEAFNAFVRSIRFPANDDKKAKPAAWTVPEAWQEAPAAGKQGVKPVATFRTAEGAGAPLATVFRFGQKSPLLQNVNRWRRIDLGLPPLQDADGLKGIVDRVKAGDHEVVLVDMRGPGARSKRRDPHAGMDIGAKPGKSQPLTDEISYTVPAGWTDIGGRVAAAMGIRIPIHTELLVDGGKAKVAVNKQRSLLGGLEGNVTRWREQQAGLKPGKTEPSSIDVGGVKASFYDFDGPRSRLLVVIAQHAGSLWIFKLTGPPGLAAKNKDAFEAFVKSVQFKGAKR